MSNRRRDGSKLSFAERDKRRREGQRRGDGRRESSRSQSHAQKSYKAALERAFADGRVEEFAATLTRASAPPSLQLPKQPDDPADAEPGPPPAGSTPARPAAAAVDPAVKKARAERRALLNKIRTAEGGREVRAAVDGYLSKYAPLPNDYEVLERALAHPDSDVVRDVLRQLLKCLDGDKPRRSRSLALQLEILSDTGDDAKVRELAEQARGKL